jgi:hypothetical protein
VDPATSRLSKSKNAWQKTPQEMRKRGKRRRRRKGYGGMFVAQRRIFFFYAEALEFGSFVV